MSWEADEFVLYHLGDKRYEDKKAEKGVTATMLLCFGIITSLSLTSAQGQLCIVDVCKTRVFRQKGSDIPTLLEIN